MVRIFLICCFELSILVHAKNMWGFGVVAVAPQATTYLKLTINIIRRVAHLTRGISINGDFFKN